MIKCLVFLYVQFNYALFIVDFELNLTSKVVKSLSFISPAMPPTLFFVANLNRKYVNYGIILMRQVINSAVSSGLNFMKFNGL